MLLSLGTGFLQSLALAPVLRATPLEEAGSHVASTTVQYFSLHIYVTCAYNPCNVCEQCIDKHGRRFIGLVRVRYVVLEGHNFVAILSVLPLPSSCYLRDRLTAPTTVALRHGVALAEAQADAHRVQGQASPGTTSGDLYILPPPPPGVQESDLGTNGWVEHVFASDDDGSSMEESDPRDCAWFESGFRP